MKTIPQLNADFFFFVVVVKYSYLEKEKYPAVLSWCLHLLSMSVLYCQRCLTVALMPT